MQGASVRLYALGFRQYAPRIALVVLWAVLLTFTVVWPILAQSADANVEFFLQAPKDKPLTVGDRITLRLEVTHPLNSQVTLPQLDPEWGALEVVDQTKPETTENNDGTATTGKDIVVTAFEPGEFQTPSLVVTHQMSDGASEELSAPVIQLTITSVLTDDTNLRDLKPQADLPVPPLWPWLVAAILLTILILGVLGGVALWLYDRYRRRPRPEFVPAPIIDTRPPEVIAYSELDRIEALNLPDQNQIKTYYSLVDLCLRRYIEGRYKIPALEQTRSELQSSFRRSVVLAEDAAEFMDILGESDLVKFARYVPHADNVHGLVNRARALVRITTPPEVVAVESTPPAVEVAQ
ncbi:MAG: hypothetical protein U0401_18900 [Anaerolineae bacterium]